MNALLLSPQSPKLAQNKMRAGTAQLVKKTGLPALAMSGAMKSGDAPPVNAKMDTLATFKLVNVCVTDYALLTMS